MITKSLGKIGAVKAKGEDQEGNKYTSIGQMWDDQLNPEYIKMVQEMSAEEKNKQRVGNKENWYQGSVEYWDKQPATNDGVLGGYGKIHEAESDTSKIMIEETK